MPEAFICDGMRTPIGRYGGALAKGRTDDLAAVPIKSLMARYPGGDWSRVDEGYLGCANQAGEGNRNGARMALLLAGLAAHRPGLCVEEAARCGARGGRPGRIVVEKDDPPRRETAREGPPRQNRFVRTPGPTPAGNASGVNDGAAAMIIASEQAAKDHGLTPYARILGMAAAGVPPRVMGIGPVPSTRKLMERLDLKIGDFDWIELNEAVASQALACLRQLGLPDAAEHVNPNGGAIALGHPLGMSGTRLCITATHQMCATGAKRALASMCVGVGQRVSRALERVWRGGF